MSRIRSRNTRPEVIVRSILRRLRYRFRTNSIHLPGHPDIVLVRHKTVIFVHGCFWHRHGHCKYAYVPKSRTDFWQKKFQANVKRDRKVGLLLRRSGWEVIVVWECQTRRMEMLASRLKLLLEN